MSSDADNHLVTRGRVFDVEYARGLDGTMPAKLFVESLELKDRVKLLALVDRMANHGEIRNDQKFKKLKGPIWEFKSHQVRVFAFREQRSWILTNGCVKKKDELDPEEIKRATRIREEHLNRLRRTKHGR